MDQPYRTVGRATAPFRAWPGAGLSLYALGAHRPALPPFAELFGLGRAGDHALRPVGGRMDGARPHPALPPVRQPWPHFVPQRRRPARAGTCPGATAAGGGRTISRGRLAYTESERNSPGRLAGSPLHPTLLGSRTRPAIGGAMADVTDPDHAVRAGSASSTTSSAGRVLSTRAELRRLPRLYPAAGCWLHHHANRQGLLQDSDLAARRSRSTCRSVVSAGACCRGRSRP